MQFKITYLDGNGVPKSPPEVFVQSGDNDRDAWARHCEARKVFPSPKTAKVEEYTEAMRKADQAIAAASADQRSKEAIEALKAEADKQSEFVKQKADELTTAQGTIKQQADDIAALKQQVADLIAKSAAGDADTKTEGKAKGK